ncbi:MAG: hypothetical protein HY296_07830 [Thaumarchaeota archaeon]|nr:hypothetical protein [Nitrososphaerota archaeon]
MKLADLDENDKALVEEARLFLEKRHSKNSGVSAGLRTATGKEFFGLNIDPGTATVGVCAEYSAIATMHSSGERRIRTLVAIAHNDKGRYTILPPCGKCRDFARAFGNPFVVLQVGRSIGESKKVRLLELIPFPWDKRS